MMGLLTAQAATTLVATAWEGLVLAGLVAATLRILPGIAAAARSMVWTAAMVAVCALPVLHRVCGANTTTTRVVLGDQVAVALIAAWLGMSVWRGTQLLRSAVWLQGVWRRAVVIGDADQSQPRLAGSMLRKATNPPVCLSDEIDRPCVVGFCAPRILIPTSLWGRLSPEQLQQIVLHETAHLGRADDWINLLQKLSLVAFPLNPVLLWIERELCIERELACDDQVLKATGARRAYAACLTNLAEHRLLQRGV